MISFMNNLNSELKEAFAKIKEHCTFQFPYWATILLIGAFFKTEIPHLKLFIILLFLLVATFQKVMTDYLPKWLLYIFQFFFVLLLVIYFFEKEILVIAQHFGW